MFSKSVATFLVLVDLRVDLISGLKAFWCRLVSGNESCSSRTTLIDARAIFRASATSQAQQVYDEGKILIHAVAIFRAGAIAAHQHVYLPKRKRVRQQQCFMVRRCTC